MQETCAVAAWTAQISNFPLSRFVLRKLHQLRRTPSQHVPIAVGARLAIDNSLTRPNEPPHLVALNFLARRLPPTSIDKRLSYLPIQYFRKTAWFLCPEALYLLFLRAPTDVTSIGLKPSFKAGEPGLRRKSFLAGATNSGSASRECTP